MEQNQVYTPIRTYSLSYSLSNHLPLFYRLEALTSVDRAGQNKEGEVFQRAFAFRSFRDAVTCQMLNDDPTSALHDYDPANHPTEAATLRVALLGVVDEPVKAESPEPSELPDDTPERESTPPPPEPEPVSAPSTPRRSRAAPSHTGSPGNFNIYFSPNVAVRVNSPGMQCLFSYFKETNYIKKTAPSSPGPSTPSRSSQAHEGLARGRRTLLAEDYTMDQVASIEVMLVTCLSAEDFAEEVHNEFGMKRLRALDVWDTYKGQ